MEKKTVNAFGCCCTRNIFNYKPINDFLSVNKYAFQIAVWACFEESLNIPEEDIEKIPERPFTKRMIHYDINKCALQEFEKSEADYFMIDLQTMSFPVYEVSYQGKKTYIQNHLGASFLPKMVEMKEFEGLSFERMNIGDVPQDIVFRGLRKFAEWVLQKYDPKKVILYLPRRARRFVTNEGIYRKYDEETLHSQLYLDCEVVKYTDYLKTIMPGINYYEYDGELLGYDENYGRKQPPALHYAEYNFMEQGTDILKMLSIDNDQNIAENINVTYISTKNEYKKMCDEVSKGILLNINKYFSLFRKLCSTDDYVLLFSSREDSAAYWGEFKKEIIGLKKDLAFKQSYVAIIDFKNNIILEECSDDIIKKDYEADGVHFSVTSGGSNCLNKGKFPVASILVQGKEYTTNGRGLNVVLYSRKEKAVVDSFVCDMNRDSMLKVSGSTASRVFDI